MLNYIWFGILVVGIVFGILNGRADQVSKALVDSAGNAVQLGIGLLGIMCLWSGFMAIVEKSGVMNIISRLLKPILSKLFPDIKKEGAALNSIIMNLTANFLGLGNAATPLGLKAMNELQRINRKKETASDSMCMFLVLNTAAIQLIPVTVIAIRTQLGSANPAEITVTVWISSICSTIAGISAVKFLSVFSKNNLK